MDTIQSPDLASLVNMLDAATEIKEQREQALGLLNIDATKAQWKKTLLDAANIKGLALSEEDADTAVNSYLSGLYAFKEPQHTASYTLARAYVDRARIGRTYGTPILGLAALTLVGWGMMMGIGAIRTSIAVGDAQKQVQQECNNILTIEESFTFAANAAVPPDFQRDIMPLVESGRKKIAGAPQNFREAYCGSVAGTVNQTNYPEAERNAAELNGMLDGASEDAESAISLVALSKGITTTRQTLESAIQETRKQQPPKVLLDRAETAYASGIAALANRQLTQGQQYTSELTTIRTSATQLAAAPQQIEQLYSSIKATAKEQQAVQQADTFYANAKSYLQQGDAPKTLDTVTSMKTLDDVLKQEYKLIVVNRQGVKSGIDRYFTDKDGKRASGYYLIIEAIDSKGAVVKVTVTNEENQKQQTVAIWGERVPKQVYDQVADDKRNDGIIQKNVLGVKERGFLDYKLTLPGTQKEGQITSW